MNASICDPEVTLNLKVTLIYLSVSGFVDHDRVLSLHFSANQGLPFYHHNIHFSHGLKHQIMKC